MLFAIAFVLVHDLVLDLDLDLILDRISNWLDCHGCSSCCVSDCGRCCEQSCRVAQIKSISTKELTEKRNCNYKLSFLLNYNYFTTIFILKNNYLCGKHTTSSHGALTLALTWHAHSGHAPHSTYCLHWPSVLTIDFIW